MQLQLLNDKEKEMHIVVACLHSNAAVEEDTEGLEGDI